MTSPLWTRLLFTLTARLRRKLLLGNSAGPAGTEDFAITNLGLDADVIGVPEVEKSGHSQASPSAVERLMREQLQAMNELFAKQLDVMRGTVPNSAMPAPVVPSPASSKTTAVSPPKAARESLRRTDRIAPRRNRLRAI